MGQDYLSGMGVPNGIARGVTVVTPSDTQDNVPASAIAFIIYYSSGSEVDGTLEIITDKDEAVTFPFLDKYWNYLAVKRIRATNFPANAIALALTV